MRARPPHNRRMDTRSAKSSGARGNPVGDLLRGWRNRRAMSHADLAFEAGISIKHLSFVETGKAVGSRDILMQLAGALATAMRCSRPAVLRDNMASAICQRRKSPTPSAPSICC
jgi:transcriptional regulator with XRE-family HTH domain